MLRILLCDDEMPALEFVTKLFSESPDVEIVASCQSVFDALDIINGDGVDLAVFDVEMPELSGVEASHRIKSDPKPLLMFVTAHPEYAVDAFGIDAIDYLLKPLDRARVQKAIEKAKRLQGHIRKSEAVADTPIVATDEDAEEVLRVKDASRYHFIPYHDIIWIEAAGDYTIVHRTESEATIRMPMKDLETLLPPDIFVRVHRSSIVAADRVSEIQMLPKGDALIGLDQGPLAPETRKSVSVRASRTFRAAVEALASRK